MKFEKFIKKVGANGRIYRGKLNDKWLGYGNVLMLIPDGYNVVSKYEIANLPIEFEELIDGSLIKANLDRAILPKADSKAKDILRVYSYGNEDKDVYITNEQWALIEAYDVTYIGEIKKDNDKVMTHLCVTNELDEEFDVKMIILNEYA